MSDEQAYKGLNIPAVSIKWGQCRFIVSEEGEDAAFCGEPVHNKSSYCERCYGVVYRPRDKRVERKMKSMVIFLQGRYVKTIRN